MTSIRSYNSEENLRRIKMQKSLAFIVVEGSDDIPIYESCLSLLTGGCENFDVVHAGGKIPIKHYLSNNRTSNAIFIIDRDFNDIGITDNRIVSLDRYSIENYFICNEVICYSLQFAIGCKLKDATEAFNLDEYINNITESLEELIKVIFYYQRVVSPNLQGEQRPAWSDAFLCKNDSWHLCEIRIRELIENLLPEPDQVTAAREYYKDNFALAGSITENFPGKILKHSLQRYIRKSVMEIKPGAKGKYNDVETTRVLLSSVLHRSKHIAKALGPAIEFLKEREPA